MYVNGLDKTIKTPFRLMQYNTTPPVTTASRMFIELNEQLSDSLSEV